MAGALYTNILMHTIYVMCISSVNGHGLQKEARRRCHT